MDIQSCTRIEKGGIHILKKFLEEFKQFALRGNVMDLAVGVIIGAAFQNIVTQAEAFYHFATLPLLLHLTAY